MPSPNRTPTRKLSQRDRRIVEHTIRYRLTTNEVVQDLFFGGRRPNAVTKVTARLCDWGYLGKFPLVHPRCYFLPARRAVQEFGVPVARTYPLGPQSLPTEYGVLAYATLGSKPLLRLTPAELHRRYATFPNAWLDAAHCLRTEASGREMLELVRVDLGGAADHVARKCVADFAQRMARSASRRLIQEQRFRLVVVTGTTEKLAAIAEALHKHAWPDGLEIHMAAAADLLPLIPNCQASSGDRPKNLHRNPSSTDPSVNQPTEN